MLVLRIILLLLLAATLNSCTAITDIRIIRLAHGLQTDHAVHKAMVFMADRVKEKSGGKMLVQVYPNGQLGTERECLELLQIGSLGITKVSAAVMETFAPSYRVYGLPYLFRDDAHRWAVLEGPIGREILADGEQFWLRGLCYYDAGYRSFYTVSKPVRTPDDLRGLKIRVQESPTAIALVQALGASATPISWGELYTSLQQGVVDGAENNPPSFQLSRHFEVARYYTLNEHTAVPDVLIVGTRVWNTLSPQEQQWLQEAADESAREQKRLWQESTLKAMQVLQDAKIEIITPDRSAFAAKVEPLMQARRSDAPLFALIERIRETK